MAQFLKATEVGTRNARTLLGAFYTSPDIFRQEQEALFLQHWLCVGREEQLPQPGDYFVRTMGTESVVIVRGRDSVVRAFHNVCRHRGARLCEEEAGHFKNVLHCPYHAWTYALDGRLLAVPSMEEVAGFATVDYPLHPVSLETWEGFLFLSFAAQPEPLETTYAPLRGKFRSYNLPVLQTARRIDYGVRANWKLIFENYSECFHCSVIHGALVKLSPADSGANDLISGAFLGGYMEVKAPDGSMTLSGKACSLAVGDLCPEDQLDRRAFLC